MSVHCSITNTHSIKYDTLPMDVHSNVNYTITLMKCKATSRTFIHIHINNTCTITCNTILRHIGSLAMHYLYTLDSMK